jgi:hypothetical protein
MQGQQPSVINIALMYVLMLILTHLGMYVLLPKDQYVGCRPPAWPSTRYIEQTRNEMFYCARTNEGFELIDSGEYVSLYQLPDKRTPAVLAYYLWTDSGTLLDRFSPMRVFDRDRSMELQVRSGIHSNHSADVDISSLQGAIATQTKKSRHAIPPESAYNMPVLSVKYGLIKLATHLILIVCAYRVTVFCKQRIEPRIRQRFQSDPFRCVHCGYNCHDLPSPICPECGHAYV